MISYPTHEIRIRYCEVYRNIDIFYCVLFILICVDLFFQDKMKIIIYEVSNTLKHKNSIKNLLLPIGMIANILNIQIYHTHNNTCTCILSPDSLHGQLHNHPHFLQPY
jgi:hypothetical protein